jgi:hypothetical protein
VERGGKVGYPVGSTPAVHLGFLALNHPCRQMLGPQAYLAILPCGGEHAHEKTWASEVIR